MSSDTRIEFTTAASLLQSENKQQITSFSPQLDKILGGGFNTGCIYEIAGASGLGKSQLCYQLCVNVQIPTVLGGLGGSAVYIDNESNFSPQRLSQIATSTIDLCNKTLKENNQESRLSVDEILSRIYLFRCMNVVQFLAATHNMAEFIQEHPEVKLIVVDSVAHWIRSEEDLRTRTVVLNNLGVNFRKMSMLNNLSVVLVNQVTTKFHCSTGKAFVVPALGESWSYIPNVKLMLSKQEDNTRHCFLYKACDRPKASCQYKITGDGFRGVKNDPCLTFHVPKFIEKPNIVQTLTTKSQKSQSTNCIQEQDISEKWLELSQHQIKNINDTENVLDNIDNESNSTPDCESDNKTVKRPSSPILSFKKRRKKCKLAL